MVNHIYTVLLTQDIIHQNNIQPLTKTLQVHKGMLFVKAKFTEVQNRFHDHHIDVTKQYTYYSTSYTLKYNQHFWVFHF